VIKIQLKALLGGRSLYWLSVQSKVRWSTINALAKGKTRRLDMDVLNAICEALDCQPGDLMVRVESKRKAGPDERWPLEKALDPQPSYERMKIMAKKNIKNENTAEEFRGRLRDIEEFVARGAVFTSTTNCSLRSHQYALLSLLDLIWNSEKEAAELALFARNEVLKNSVELFDDAVERLVGEMPPEVNA
jgi:DNA-binding Xre family transcriptional regulator